MVFDEMLVKKSIKKCRFFSSKLKRKRKILQIIGPHCLGPRWSTVADAAVDPRADNP
jgi:hypothetical protein